MRLVLLHGHVKGHFQSPPPFIDVSVLLPAKFQQEPSSEIEGGISESVFIEFTKKFSDWRSYFAPWEAKSHSH